MRGLVKPTNLLIILSDQHSREVLGCYGNRLVKTPHLDALAQRGTRFANAYCNSPICVPARASLATGLYVHTHRCWDNAHPYHGQRQSWGHHLADAGHAVVSIGKLHYRSSDDSNGFTSEVIPLHVLDGVGDPLGSLRRPPAPRGNVASVAWEAGRGHSTYTAYDEQITDKACAWLCREAPRLQTPWVLFVGLVLPHPPMVAAPEFFDMYAADAMPWPRQYDHSERPQHPVLRALRLCLNHDDHFDEERVRTALRAYYGMVSCLDHNIGRVLAALDASGQTDATRIMYASDHGENLGNRGIWGKFVMYEESAGVPLILAGPDVPRGKVLSTPVSLVDVFPTVLDAVGRETNPDEARPGESLLQLAQGGNADRTILCEYHAVGAITGCFMLRRARWKYVHYVGYQPQLFDMAADPHEQTDLGESEAHQSVRADCEAALRGIVDPAGASEQAFRDQAALITRHGGAERVRARGDFGNTPAPGEEPVFT